MANEDKKYEFAMKWPVLDANKEKFSKDDVEKVKKMVEEHLKTEAQKEIFEKRVSGSKFRINNTHAHPTSPSVTVAPATPTVPEAVPMSPPRKSPSFISVSLDVTLMSL